MGGSVGVLGRWVGCGNGVGMRKLEDRKCWENGFFSTEHAHSLSADPDWKKPCVVSSRRQLASGVVYI